MIIEFTVLYDHRDPKVTASTGGAVSDRRIQIAEAGIRILATRGAHALTHLNIDRDLGFAQGSTSYYARTRRDLLTLVVGRLADHTDDDLAAQPIPDELTPEMVAATIVAGLDTTMQRADDHRARLLLLLECRSDPELHAALATRPAIRDSAIALAGRVLDRLGVNDPTSHAGDFVALMDSLLMQRVIRTAPINETAILTAYLKGLRPSGG